MRLHPSSRMKPRKNKRNVNVYSLLLLHLRPHDLRPQLIEPAGQHIESALRLHPGSSVADLVASVSDPHIASFRSIAPGFSPIGSPRILDEPGAFIVIPSDQRNVVVDVVRVAH